MREHLLDILCCPITRRALKGMPADELERLNVAIGNGELRNQGSQTVTGPLAEALITLDGELVYPVRDGIPLLLADECINWSAYRDLTMPRL
jgi:uncharacterized protein YbaR (Trm112 family)